MVIATPFDAPGKPAGPFAPSALPYRFSALDVRRDWAWVQQNLPCHLVEDTAGIIAVDSYGHYAAAVVLDNWTVTAVSAHIAVLDRLVLRHKFLSIVADSVFVHARRSVMIGMVPADNEKALRFDKHIGFTELFRIKDGFAHGVDYVILEMRRESCRWITARKHDG